MNAVSPELDVGDFFHSIEPATPSGEKGDLIITPQKCGFQHLCGRDTYNGEFKVISDVEFEWNWSITGPAKDGRIFQRLIKLESNHL